jgi:hypothetical protein
MSPIPQPPRWADRLLGWFCAPHLLEEVQGDLHERFGRRAERFGAAYARRQYVAEVLGFLRPAFLKKKPGEYSSTTLIHHAMLRNYLTVACRNLVRNRFFSLINIGGLAVGMAVAVLNGLWVWDELSFNKYHRNYDRIAQVVKRQTYNGETGIGQTMVYPLGTELQARYSGHFKHLVRASSVQEYILSAGRTKLSAGGQFMDPQGPEMLSLDMKYGSRAALGDPYAIVLSARMARALFGDRNPVNQVVTLNNETPLTVTGVYEDLPANTTFHEAEFLAPWALFLRRNDWIKKTAAQDWRNHFIQIYAEIPPGADFEGVSRRIRDAELRNLAGYPEQQAKNPQVLLYPMSRWHLFPYDSGQPDRAPVRMVWLVGTIGLFVLLLACINFMNLTTARSGKRAREVGIRKTIGSGRRQLIGQFLGESLLVATLALLVALLLAWGALGWFNTLAAKQIVMPWGNPWFWAGCLAFVSLTGVLAGSYPALYLSSFQPVKVLKGTFRVGRLAAVPRQAMVIGQFTVSVTLMISTVIVYRQVQHAKNRPVGYTREGLITMQMKSGDFYGKYDVLRTELKKTGAVTEMSQSMGPVTEVYSGNGGFEWKGKNPGMRDNFGTLAVTHEHGGTVGWQFVAGRDFSRQFASDSSGLVINEAAARYMGLRHPVGEWVTWNWWEKDRPPLHYRILGVVKDMVMESPYEPTQPALFYLKGHNGSVSWINIRINPKVAAGEAIPRIEAVFRKIIPSAPFEYAFVDEAYAAKFAAEERIAKLAGFFASLAIFISCLGLFGLASFVAEQRTKEIGIRKVMGASVVNLWQMLSKDFLVLVVLSCLVAVPASYYFMGGWLQGVFVPHPALLVDFRGGRSGGFGHCPADGQFPEHQSRADQSGEKPAQRIATREAGGKATGDRRKRNRKNRTEPAALQDHAFHDEETSKISEHRRQTPLQYPVSFPTAVGRPAAGVVLRAAPARRGAGRPPRTVQPAGRAVRYRLRPAAVRSAKCWAFLRPAFLNEETE